jgi:ribosomal protein S18 acetylase RimI-like enzyme
MSAVSFAGSDILMLRDGDVLKASVMVGFDGHRGWVYYLAVPTDSRRMGYAARIMDAAAAWLIDMGAPKMQLMVRDRNDDALAFYSALGFERQGVSTLSRFLTGN